MPELRKVPQQVDGKRLKGLVFDLRDNPGGGLQTAIDVASLFIKDGPIVIERGKPGTQDTRLFATGKTLAPDVPMVVLINAGSASASELVSGAFQDYHRSTLLVMAGYLLAKCTHAPNLRFASAIGQGICQNWSPLGLARIEDLWLKRTLMGTGFITADADVLPLLHPLEFFRPAQIDSAGN